MPPATVTTHRVYAGIKAPPACKVSVVPLAPAVNEVDKQPLVVGVPRLAPTKVKAVSTMLTVSPVLRTQFNENVKEMEDSDAVKGLANVSMLVCSAGSTIASDVAICVADISVDALNATAAVRDARPAL
jgi:hypothetical protein